MSFPELSMEGTALALLRVVGNHQQDGTPSLPDPLSPAKCEWLNRPHMQTQTTMSHFLRWISVKLSQALFVSCLDDVGNDRDIFDSSSAALQPAVYGE